MISPNFINQLGSQISKLAQTKPLADLENNIKAILQAALSKLDLVTRSEFAVQQQVLLETRKKLEELEQVVQKLEQSTTSNEHC
jgi:BMFP domain-containing protein YqiC